MHHLSGAPRRAQVLATMLAVQDVGNQISPGPLQPGVWFSAALQLVGHHPPELGETCPRPPPPCPSIPGVFSARQCLEALVGGMAEEVGEEQEEET